jgi:hypothetical protein
MPGLFSTPIPPPDLDVRWTGREVLKDLFGKPHLLLRVTITGPHFPHRATEPFVKIGKKRSRFVYISEDGLRADAYFDLDDAASGELVFGHGDDVELIVPDGFSADRVERLDRGRLPEETVLHWAERDS